MSLDDHEEIRGLPDREWLSVSEVAEFFGVNAKTIRAAMKAGQLPYVELGRRQLVSRRVLVLMTTQGRVLPPRGKP